MAASLTILDRISPEKREVFLSVLRELTAQAPHQMFDIPLKQADEKHVVLVPVNGNVLAIPLDGDNPTSQRLRQRFEQGTFIELGEIVTTITLPN
jgi:hypothetical protein